VTDDTTTEGMPTDDTAAERTAAEAPASLAGLVASRIGGQVGRNLWTSLGPAEAAARAISPSGFRGIDRLLPAGGICRGTLVEWIGEPASGVATLAFAVAGRLRGGAAGSAGPILVVDRRGRFHPPAVMPWLDGPVVGKPKVAAATGALVVVRPSRDEDELWAIDQALRCPGLTAVVAWPERVSSTSLRRWQLAARGSGTVGFLVRPVRARREPSWAEARLNVSAVAALGRWRGGEDLPWAPAVASLAVRRLRVSLQEGPWACEQPPDLPTVEIALDLATGREAIGDGDGSVVRKAGPWSAAASAGRHRSPGVLPDANGAGGVSCRAS